MAFNQTRVPANIGQASTNAGGNQGFWNPVYTFNYFEPGSPTARNIFPFANVPTNCVLIGCAAALNVVGSTNTTFMPQSLRCGSVTGGAVTSALQVCSSNAIVVGSAILGPAYTATIAWQGQAAQTVLVINNSSGGAAVNNSTQLSPFVLGAFANRQFSQGDAVAISTSGALSSVTGMSFTAFLADYDGAY